MHPHGAGAGDVGSHLVADMQHFGWVDIGPAKRLLEYGWMGFSDPTRVEFTEKSKHCSKPACLTKGARSARRFVIIPSLYDCSRRDVKAGSVSSKGVKLFGDCYGQLPNLPRQGPCNRNPCGFKDQLLVVREEFEAPLRCSEGQRFLFVGSVEQDVCLGVPPPDILWRYVQALGRSRQPFGSPPRVARI